jgi:hypothetical protein
VQANQAGDSVYNSAPPVQQSFNVVLSGKKVDQTITFVQPSDVTVGDPVNPLVATSTSGLAVTFVSQTTAVCTVTGASVTVKAAGVCTIQARQAGNTAYNAAVAATKSFTITKAVLLVAATDAARVYGAANPAFRASYGSPPGAKPAGVSGAPLCSVTPPVTAMSPAGPYPITCSAGTLTSAKYSFTFAPGTLSITPKALTAKPSATSRVYGAPDPVFTVTYVGFANGETLATSGVSGAPACGSNTGPQSPVGASYAITCTSGSLTANNYTFTFPATGKLSITKATLTVTADPKTRPRLQANPPLTATITGYVGGDVAPANVTGAPTCATTAKTNSAAGTYPITCTKGTLASGNYQFTLVAGTLTVTP